MLSADPISFGLLLDQSSCHFLQGNCLAFLLKVQRLNLLFQSTDLPFKTLIFLEEPKGLKLKVLHFIFSLPKVLTEILLPDHNIENFHNLPDIVQHFLNLDLHNGKQFSLMDAHPFIESGFKIVNCKAEMRILLSNCFHCYLSFAMLWV